MWIAFEKFVVFKAIRHNLYRVASFLLEIWCEKRTMKFQSLSRCLYKEAECSRVNQIVCVWPLAACLDLYGLSLERIDGNEREQEKGGERYEK